MESKLRDKESEISKLNALVSEERQSMRVLEEDFINRKSQLESYIAAERERSSQLEAEKVKLRAELAVVETALAEKQNLITKSASKLAESADEIRSLKLELDASTKEFREEIEALRVEKEKAGRTINHLNELLNQAEADVDHYKKNSETVQRYRVSLKTID